MALRAMIGDFRLSLEVAVITTLAQRIVRLIKHARSPERERAFDQVRRYGRHAGRAWRRARSRASRGADLPRTDPRMHERARDTDRQHSQPQPRVRQLVLCGDADPAAAAARGDVRDLRLLPPGRRHCRFARAARRAPRRARGVARRHRGALCRPADARGPAISPSRCAISASNKADFLSVIDGMEMDVRRRYPGAELVGARSLLRPGRERGRPAVGARSSASRRSRAASLPIISDGRCSSPISCATSTRTPRSDASTCRARRCAQAGIATTDRPPRWRARRSIAPARNSSRRRASISTRPTRSWRRARAAPCGRRASWARSIGSFSKAWRRADLPPPRPPVRLARLRLVSSSRATPSSDAAHRSHHRRRPCRPGSGRSPRRRAASRPSSTRRPIRPAAAAAPMMTPRPDMRIDNGTHILLSGNTAALGFLAAIGAAARVAGAAGGALSLRRSCDQGALDARSRRRPAAAVDVRSAAPGARHARRSIIWRCFACCGRRRTGRSARSSFLQRPRL